MKVLKVAAIVVGAVALIATGVGALAGAGLIGTTVAGVTTVAGIAAGTWATIGTIATLASTALSLGAALTAKKPDGPAYGGQPQNFKLDPQAPVPCILGRGPAGGFIVHRTEHGATKDKVSNPFQTFAIVWSLGMVDGIESIQVDRTPVAFVNGAAQGNYAGYMWLDTQLGASPEADALSTGEAVPGWGASHKLSGLCAGLWRLRFDKEGKKYPAGEPLLQAIIRGVKVYDPRLDSTYPGGSGPCRALQEETYVYSENPWLHALTYALGRWQNGKRVFGVGMPINAIDVAAFVEAANIADVNQWKIGGTITSADQKWNALKLIAQAGGGEPIRQRSKLSCMISTPRVSLATITEKDLVGRGSVTGTQRRRDRINGIVPRIPSEAHGWEVTPLDVVRVADYVTVDGGERTREMDFPLVPYKDQAAELAMYDIVNAREFGPITLPLKPKFMGYRPGDCLTLNIPEMGLDNQPAIIVGRSLDPSTGMVTLEFKSETPGKHAFALGKTGVAPPTPSLKPADLSQVAPPDPNIWALESIYLTSPSTLPLSTGSTPALAVTSGTGPVDNPGAEFVIFEIRKLTADEEGEVTAGEWSSAQTVPADSDLTKRIEFTNVAPSSQYEAAVSYQVRGVIGERRILGPVITKKPIAGGVVPKGIDWSAPPATNPIANVPDALAVDENGHLNAGKVAYSGATVAAWLAQHAAAIAALQSGLGGLDNAVDDLKDIIGEHEGEGLRSRIVNIENITDGQATSIYVLQTSFTDLETDLTAIVGEMQQTTATEFSAIGSRLTLVESEITTARGGYGSLSAKIGNFSQTIADLIASKAEATVVTNISAELSNARGGQPSLSAKLQSMEQATVDGLAGKASALSVTNLEATVGNVTGRVTTVEQVTADISGKVNSSISLLADAGGKIAGMRINASNVTVSTVDVIADVFRFVAPGSALTPFAVSGTEMRLRVPLAMYDASNNLRILMSPG